MDFISCARCHPPENAFAERKPPRETSLTPLSLINVVYNRRQFWDGRVETLEETLVRSREDERPISSEQNKSRALGRHVWGGFVRALDHQGRYNKDFDLAFGVRHPTQDTVARALAAYMRTILSGDSIYDRAVQHSQNPAALTQKDFEAVLKDKKLIKEKILDLDTEERHQPEAVPALVARGYKLFHGKAQCATCHPPPLFTDQDYHNVLAKGPGLLPGEQETGRAVHVPIGHKDPRLVGAFRTPSLRNLTATYPYFHDGKLTKLRDVVEFFQADWRLELTEEEIDALVMFLRALEGTPVDPIITGEPR